MHRPTAALIVPLILQLIAFLAFSNGKMVNSAFTHCDPNTLSPGGVGSFTVMLNNDTRFDHVKLDFIDREKAVPWVDWSGKDAHQ